MPIIFSAVAYDNNIISEFASCDGNFMEILQQVVSKIPSCDHKMTYFHGPYLIHYILENRYLYFCITDKMCQRSRAFLFLNEIHRQYLADGKKGFTKVLAAQMYTYSEDYNSTIIIRKGELDEVNRIGVESSVRKTKKRHRFMEITKVLAAQMYTYSEDYNSTIIIRKGELDEVNRIGVESSENIIGEKVLFVNNPENISYAMVSYVGKTPERVSISVENPRLYVIIIGVLVLIIIGMFFALSPMSCVILLGVIGCSFVKCFRKYKKSV